MAITCNLIDYTPAIRNSQLFIQLVASGSYVNGTGDTVNLTNLVNVNGIDTEGLFEVSLVPPTVEVQDIGAFTSILRVTGKTLSNMLIQFYSLAGAELASGLYSTNAPAIIAGTLIIAANRRSV